VLAAQLLFGALFGILGLLLADPILAAIKVTLEKLSEREKPAIETAPAVSSGQRLPSRRRRKS
jgi:predicted PurR-regulated permease PerM